MAENIRGEAASRQTREFSETDEQITPPLSFFLGEHFRLRVMEVTSAGEVDVIDQFSLASQSPSPLPITSEFFPQPTRLFPSTVLIQFTENPEEFFPVHSGTSTLEITIGGERFPVSVEVPTCAAESFCGFRLGTIRNEFDDDIIRFADLRGIPP